MSETVMPVAIESNKRSAGTPLWVRVSHGLFAILFLALVYSGIALTYSYSDFALMDYELASTVHEVTGIAISILYVAFIIYMFYSKYWSVYKRRSSSLRQRMMRVLARMSGAKLGEPQDGAVLERRFVASTQFLLQFQLLAYLVALLILMPLLIITGLAYLYPETSPAKVLGFAGLWPVAVSHYIVGLLGTLFIIIHIYISTIAGFRRIIFGR
jgi:thiosulfate reductase cytochrome b subunit